MSGDGALTQGKLINARPIVARIDAGTRDGIQALWTNGIQPTLAVIHHGEHADAASYRRMIVQRAARLGLDVREIPLAADSPPALLRETLDHLGHDQTIHGVLVQTPWPPEWRQLISDHLSPLKDVEGITPGNLGRLLLSDPIVLPCTAAAVVALIESRIPDLAGRRVVVVNNSATVGRPLAHLLLQRRATVTICATATVDLALETRRAEVLVTAIGSPRYFGPEHIAPGTLVIDVGINELPDGSICGDVDLDAVVERVAAITPVPGGVGPVTTALLTANTVELARIGHASGSRAYD